MHFADMAYKNGEFHLNLNNFYPYFIDEVSALDIDTELDFKFAKFLIEENGKFMNVITINIPLNFMYFILSMLFVYSFIPCLS